MGRTVGIPYCIELLAVDRVCRVGYSPYDSPPISAELRHPAGEKKRKRGESGEMATPDVDPWTLRSPWPACLAESPKNRLSPRPMISSCCAPSNNPGSDED